jgi:hypothetical protein
MRKEIPFLKTKEKLAENLKLDLLFLYLQLPLLIESWPNIEILFFIILLLVNTGTAYFMNQSDLEKRENLNQNSIRNFSIGWGTLALLYLYSIGLWFIPMICLQFAFLFPNILIFSFLDWLLVST